MYMLTPRGLSEKTELPVRFLKKNVGHEMLKNEIDALKGVLLESDRQV